MAGRVDSGSGVDFRHHYHAKTIPFPVAEQPNVLIVYPDQYGPDWIELDETVPVRTPTVDALAGRGVFGTQSRQHRSEVPFAPVSGPEWSTIAGASAVTGSTSHPPRGHSPGNYARRRATTS